MASTDYGSYQRHITYLSSNNRAEQRTRDILITSDLSAWDAHLGKQQFSTNPSPGVRWTSLSKSCYGRRMIHPRTKNCCPSLLILLASTRVYICVYW